MYVHIWIARVCFVCVCAFSSDIVIKDNKHIHTHHPVYYIHCDNWAHHTMLIHLPSINSHSSAAHTPTCCIWVGTDKGNVIMMTVDIESPTTEDQPRILELGRKGNILCSAAYHMSCFIDILYLY